MVLSLVERKDRKMAVCWALMLDERMVAEMDGKLVVYSVVG